MKMSLFNVIRIGKDGILYIVLSNNRKYCMLYGSYSAFILMTITMCINLLFNVTSFMS